MSQENVEVVERFLIEIGVPHHADLADDLLSEFFDAEVEWIPIPQGVLSANRYVGFDGIRGFAGDFLAAWDEMVIEPESLQDAGDVIVAHSRMRGRVPKLEIDEVWVAIFTLRDRKIIRVQALATRGESLEVAGLRE
jgi:hypothetical protein